MSITRRKFLGWIGAAGAGSLAAGTATASSKQFDGHPDSYGVLHDISRCIGCRACETACNKVNDLEVPGKPFTDLSVLDEKRRTENNNYTVVNKFEDKKNPGKSVFVKKQCNHCMEPSCASVCFVQAFKKSASGAVTYNPDVCVGCRYCMVACPFNIPTYEYDEPFNPEVRKCTLCKSRTDEGKLPGCVEICPKDALVYGKRDELLKMARKRIEKHPNRYVDHIYGETEMGGTSWLYISGVPFSEIGMREDLGTVSGPELTHGALSVVPMVVGIWPAFLAGMYAMTKRREKIADEEKQEAVETAVNSAVEETQAAADKKLEAAITKADKDKTTAVDKAVKDALEEAAKAAEPEEPETPEEPGKPEESAGSDKPADGEDA